MLRPLLFAWVLITNEIWTPIAETTYTIWKIYPDNNCSTEPGLLFAEESEDCSYETCYSGTNNDVISADCTPDYMQYMEEFFGDTKYIIQVEFTGRDCATFSSAMGFRAGGTCEAGYNTSVAADSDGETIFDKFYYNATLDENGTASIEFFTTADCSSGGYEIASVSAIKSVIDSHMCAAADYNSFIYPTGVYWEWYTRNSDDHGGGVSIGAIVCIVLSSIVVLLVILVIFYRRCTQVRRNKMLPSTFQTGDLSMIEVAPVGQQGLWNDDVITAKRIPRDKVRTEKLISRGAFGEVYSGVYNGQNVAIKMLLRPTRGSLEQVNDFLAEAKMSATMDHLHIVTFIGVAWDSLSDLCVVLEFMDGGDLRTLLDRYNTVNHPVGFDQGKTIIAMHVCHALTYLHSLLPPVIHRDLKSRNILLNKALEAKLTDFGISRERLDQTMTAGVGTSLWMAPEVMLGEKYGVKADMFSFGVVLSELDVHTLPYAQAKQRSLDTDGRQLADATLLQKVTMGEIRVEFSEANPESLVELGLACVAVDPNERPTAAEALYRLQLILSKNLPISL